MKDDQMRGVALFIDHDNILDGREKREVKVEYPVLTDWAGQRVVLQPDNTSKLKYTHHGGI